MESLIRWLQQASKKAVVVVGDVGIDEYLFGAVSRISPEAPVPVVKEDRREYYFGCAANTALNCHVLGMDVVLVGVINSSDAHGLLLKNLLKKEGLSGDSLIDSRQRKTTMKTRVVAQNHHCLRIDSEDAMPLMQSEFDAICAELEKKIQRNSIVLISDYAKGVVTEELVKKIVVLARERDCLIIADPKGPYFSKYHGVDFLKPNASEFRQMVQRFDIPEELSMVEQGRLLCKFLSIKGLIITLGDKGMMYVSQNDSIYSPAFQREVFDLSGAGDTVFAYLAFGLAHNVSLKDTLLLANKAASVAVSHLKTYAVRLEELLDEKIEVQSKVFYDWLNLKKQVEFLRSQDKQIVFTNGCFDLLHAGHVKCLEEAKKQGDILIVALNTDASIQRLNKGPERPINCLDDRAAVIAGLEAVSFVTSFDQDTPLELIQYLEPDVLVKGGDYAAESIVGYKEVVSRGGRVCIVPLVEGKSTSKMVKKAQIGLINL